MAKRLFSVVLLFIGIVATSIDAAIVKNKTGYALVLNFDNGTPSVTLQNNEYALITDGVGVTPSVPQGPQSNSLGTVFSSYTGMRLAESTVKANLIITYTIEVNRMIPTAFILAGSYESGQDAVVAQLISMFPMVRANKATLPTGF